MSRRARRWALGGALFGGAVGALAWAPAAWLAAAVAAASGDRLLLSDARGSVWSGSAVPVLTGGAGSRDASALPGRLSWTLRLEGLALAVQARHECCLNGTLRLRVEPGLGQWRVTLPGAAGAAGADAPAVIGQWPAGWLAGLGTPFNTLQLGGWLVLSSRALTAESAQGRWRLAGSASLAMNGVSSRLSTLDSLGSWRLDLAGGDVARLSLSTLQGPLRLSGSGELAAAGLRFRGEARADAGAETALNNLLNLLGRRQGASAILSIG